ncbi:hypothetical protein HPS57_03400 [Prevotella sp. PINT]|jgi:hypothetical protein|uniref:Cbp1 family collagen-binding glycoprotein adhesin n=1 Tax=Palleniella intestinalis TaxID=2736291 RepID=UPI0015531ACB|nr:hypothetical protein [Palleniella intestinalis]NPD81023.1 hypothetical protein [Palleniella intestinalis]
MKKIIYLAFCLMCFTACENTQKQQSDNTESRDSLQRVIEQKNNEINDMLGTLNEIQEGFRQISIAEDRVTVIKDGEATSRKEQIRSDIEFIAQQMQHNRELIAKLQKQAREGSIAAEQLKKTIENLTAQLEEKNKQLETLRTELHAKDLRIEVLDLAVSSLNNDVEELRNESATKSATISNQDKQLNTAWYVFGTKKELAENRILEKGKVLRANFNKNYFTKIDVRVDKEIKLYSKSAKLLTSHPSTSYTLQPDASKQYVLRITNPELFWSTSKYLVIQVK